MQPTSEFDLPGNSQLLCQDFEVLLLIAISGNRKPHIRVSLLQRCRDP